MKLADWIRRNHGLGDRLKVVESLCRAVATDHEGGIVHGVLDPQEIDVSGDGECQIGVGSAALVHAPGSAPYRAPEVSGGAAATAKADVFSAGVICYEVLSGKHPDEGGGQVKPLREVRPDLSRDLADAVTACVERDPEWRPADLSYVQQVAQKLITQGGGGGGKGAAAGRAQKESRPFQRDVRAPAPLAGTTRAARARAQFSLLPLVIGGLVVVVLAGFGFWFYYLRPTPPPRTTARATPPPATAAPSATLPPVTEPPTTEATDAEATPPAPSPTPEAAVVPPVEATPIPTPTPLPTSAPVVATPPPTPPPTPTPLETPPPTPPPTPTPAPALPPVLTTLSPYTLKAGSPAVVDVHGEHLRRDLVPRVVAAASGAPAAGIRVLGKRFVRSDLMQVSFRVDPGVKPGAYTFTMVGSDRQASNPLSLIVAK